MYSSSKWPCLFILLQLRLGCQCLEQKVATRDKTSDLQDNYSFIVNICLTVDENIELYSGVLISKDHVMSVCQPFVKTVDQDGQVQLPVDDFRVWAGHTEERGQWRSVVNVRCIDPSVSNSKVMKVDFAILVVQHEFDLSRQVFPLGLTARMTAEEIISASGSRVECEVITWSVKFKAKLVPDLEVCYLKKCPVETLTMNSCASFLSAEVTDTSTKELTEKNLMCVFPHPTSNGSCLESILLGSPVMCSKKVLGIVSRTKDAALIDIFPIVLSIIEFKMFHVLGSSGGTLASVLYTALMTLVLNTVLL